MESDKSIAAPSDGSGEGGMPIVQRIRPLHGRTSGPARRSTKGQWTAEEDEILRKAVQRFKGKNWKKIAECFKDRTDVQCLHRWQKVLNPELVKGPWSKEEDEIIIEMVNKYGPKKWSTIAQHLPGRIGKQCRERWHNHLNPSINKEAWTQQEELALIRAHQIYGNRWAELTKFLPGRTDNAIKNHWNSSVKKKLDSYLASGLLEQFQGLPLVPHQNQPMPASSRVQSGGENSGLKCGVEAEEISECSQESMVAGCSQSVSGLGNPVFDTTEEFCFTEAHGLEKEQSSSPASCPEHYLTSVGEVMFTIPSEMATSSNFLQQDFSNISGTPASSDYQYDIQQLPNIPSFELGQDPSGFPTHCTVPNESHELVTVPFQTSMGLNVPVSLVNVTENSAKPDNMFVSDDECCQFLFSEVNGATLAGNIASGLKSLVHLDSSNCQSSNNQFSGPSLHSADDTTLKCGKDSNQLVGHTYAAHGQEYITSENYEFIDTRSTASSPCHDCRESTIVQEQSYLKEPLKLVPVDTFCSGPDAAQSGPEDKTAHVKTEKQDAGVLCYEPPRFPSLDMPFLSCELVQSGSDILQEYSPLGIRQLMSSMNCITPFRLWDSPSQDNSPDAVLKTAAKTFSGTPSILKKRNRDLLSPLSDRRLDKKLEMDMTISLSKEFSRLDVMLDDSEAQRTSSGSPSSNKKKIIESFDEDKENVDPATGGEDKQRDPSPLTDHKMNENDNYSRNFQENAKHGTVHVDAKTKDLIDASGTCGVNVEDSMSDLLFVSPDVDRKADRAFGPSSRTPKNFCRKILGALSEHTIASESSPSQKNSESHALASASVQSYIPSESAVDNCGNDAGTENLSIFGGTPFKRSIESPSAWKSPWFINSFLPGPRVDTDISIEDIGYFMSPGERSYDAIALMKQLSEHTASTFAEALEVLGNETPETILQKRRSNMQNMDHGNNSATNIEAENHSQLASNISTECRTLDFSECGTPGKGTDRVRSSTSVSFSSPSSYLLKGCR